MPKLVCLNPEPFKTTIRIYYEDTDAGGVVYHANYLRFMERCRSEWLETIGFSVAELQDELGVVFVVRKADVDFISPARLLDKLTVDCSVLHVGKVKLEISQKIYNDKKLLCFATIKLATLDKTSFKLAPMPQLLREAIAVNHEDNH